MNFTSTGQIRWAEMPLEGIRIFFILIIAKDNKVEYEALLVGLRMAKQAGVEIKALVWL